MAESKKAVVSLKEAVITGAILDLLLFVLSGMILDGGFLVSIMFFLIIAHWTGNTMALISKKARQSRAGKNFVRFGLLPLIFVSFAVRALLEFLGIGF